MSSFAVPVLSLVVVRVLLLLMFHHYDGVFVFIFLFFFCSLLIVCIYDVFWYFVGAEAGFNWYLRYMNIFPLSKKKFDIPCQYISRNILRGGFLTIIFSHTSLGDTGDRLPFTVVTSACLHHSSCSLQPTRMCDKTVDARRHGLLVWVWWVCAMWPGLYTSTKKDLWIRPNHGCYK